MRIEVSDEVYLSEFARSDEAACLEHINDKQVYDCTLRIPYPYTAADFDNWMKIVENATRTQGQPIHWAIRERRGGQLIGAFGFVDFEIGQSHRGEVGYWVAAPYRGRGIAPAAVRRVCQHAFAKFGVVKVTATVFAGNESSARVLQKSGFKEEGYLRKHYLKDGRYIDARVFGLLKE